MDQIDMWNKWHGRHIANDDMPLHVQSRNHFIEALPLPNKSSPVLEVGCGQGYDSVAIATAGYSVCALDFSEVAIRIARRNIPADTELKLSYACRDVSRSLPYANAQFEGVFSYLSLHYFTTKVTREIFGEIARVTKPSGIFSVSVKSTEDPLFGQGEELDHNLFIRNGHIRHFFDTEEIVHLLCNTWTISRLETAWSYYLSSAKPKACITSVLAVRNE